MQFWWRIGAAARPSPLGPPKSDKNRGPSVRRREAITMLRRALEGRSHDLAFSSCGRREAIDWDRPCLPYDRDNTGRWSPEHHGTRATPRRYEPPRKAFLGSWTQPKMEYRRRRVSSRGYGIPSALATNNSPLVKPPSKVWRCTVLEIGRSRRHASPRTNCNVARGDRVLSN